MQAFGFDFGKMLRTTRSRRVTPPIPPKQIVSIVDEEPELATPVERNDASAWSAFIAYANAKGEASQRRITLHRIEGTGAATHLYAYCHERQQDRSFRVDRIQQLACCETGEVLDPALHFEMLRTTGAARCKDKLLTDVVRVGSFLARCDGDYHPLEREAINTMIERYCLNFGGSDRLCRDTGEDAKRLAPDGIDMVKALGRIAKAPQGSQIARFMLHHGAEVIEADGRINTEEFEWAVEMSNALKAIADSGRA